MKSATRWFGLRGPLAGPGPARDIVALNAGAALYVAGVADSIEDGIGRARDAITDGRAATRLQAFIETTRRLAAEAK